MSARYRGRHHRRAASVRRPLIAAGVLAVASLLVAGEPAATTDPAVAEAPTRNGLGSAPQSVVGPRAAHVWTSALPRLLERASRGAERVARRPRGRVIRARVVASLRKRLHAAPRHRPHRPHRDRLSRFDGPQRRGIAAAVRFAIAQAGDSYVWGASGPRAWDCSGLVVAYAARLGVRLPHQSMRILGSRHIRRVSRGQLKRGDLVWPNSGHIAIYLGHGRIVHAANRREGVRIAPLYGFVAGGRIVA